jgi:flagellar biosynthesis anti-sigma factor FlgM
MKIHDKMISGEVTGNACELSRRAADRLEKERRSPEKQGQEPPPKGGAIVQFSQVTKESETIREVLASLPEVRAEKVALMRERIESGTYEMNYESVAEKLVDAFMDDKNFRSLPLRRQGPPAPSKRSERR